MFSLPYSEPVPACLSHFNVARQNAVEEARQPSSNDLLRKVLMVGGTLNGFRTKDGRFYPMDDDGTGACHRLSFADTDYLAHLITRLRHTGHAISARPEVSISNIAFNGSVFKHVDAGARTDCIVLANLFWDPKSIEKASPRRKQDTRNFNGESWRHMFEKAGARVLAVIRSDCHWPDKATVQIPQILQEQGGFKVVDQSNFERRCLSGKQLNLRAEILLPH